jgi:hypothetical protein
MSMSPRHPVDQVADGAEPAPASASRRRFVRNVGLGAAALGAVAVTGTALSEGASAQSSGSAATPPDLGPADVALAQFNQSLLLAAAEGLSKAAEATYLESETREEIRLFSRHHTTQAAAVGALLAEAQQITTPNPKLLADIESAAGGAADQVALLSALQKIESNLAATMLAGIGQAQLFLVAEAMATVQPVLGQQAAALGSAANQDIGQWLPAFGTTDGAYTPAAYPVS